MSEFVTAWLVAATPLFWPRVLPPGVPKEVVEERLLPLVRRVALLRATPPFLGLFCGSVAVAVDGRAFASP
jgi:hypothetical protein